MKNLFKIRVLIIMTLIVLSLYFCVSCSTTKQSSKSSEQASKIKSLIEVKPLENIPTIEQIIITLCSDEFEGRRTFSDGNEKAGEYIAKNFRNIGLDPLSENSYFQKYTQNVSYSSEKEAKEAAKNKDNSYKVVNNIIGYIKGKNNEKAIVISAHFDSLGTIDGNINRGALDNASGVSALIEIAKKLKLISVENPFETNIIICAFNGEEQLFAGSAAFVNQCKSKSWYKNMYNINIDCIGAKNGGDLTFPNDSKYSKKLYDAVKSSMYKSNIDLAETNEIQGSDHRSFEKVKKANINICRKRRNK